MTGQQQEPRIVPPDEARMLAANAKPGPWRFATDDSHSDPVATILAHPNQVGNAALLTAAPDLAHTAAVLALHRPSDNHGEAFDPYCVGCWEAGGEDGAPSYPCATARALGAPNA